MKESEMKPEFCAKYENAFNRTLGAINSDKTYIPEGLYKLYFSLIRKILMICYLAINAVFYGLSKETNNSQYQISQGLECFMILLMLGDAILNIYIARLKHLYVQAYLITTAILLCICFALKLSSDNISIISVYSVMRVITVVLVFISFKEIILLKSLRQLWKRDKVFPSMESGMNILSSPGRLSNRGLKNVNMMIELPILDKNEGDKINNDKPKIEHNRLSIENNFNCMISKLDKQIEDYFIKPTSNKYELEANSSGIFNNNNRLIKVTHINEAKPSTQVENEHHLVMIDAPEQSRESENIIISKSIIDNGSNRKVLQLHNHLSKILSVEFDVFELNDSTLNNSLYTVMTYFFYYYKMEGKYPIDKSKYFNLIWNIQKNYNDNPYHNLIHACDAAVTLFTFIEKYGELRCSNTGLSEFEIVVCLISAAAHDISHPGNNNLFEVNTHSALSIFYNDRSVLESFHIYVLYNLLSKPELNIFENIDIAKEKEVRKLIITNIFSTDISNHKQDFDKLAVSILKAKQLVVDLTSPSSIKSKLLEDKSSKLLVMNELVHIADISNPTKKFKVYKRWVEGVFEEFFSQGDRERELGLPVSMLCDRDTTNIPNSQIFFINFFVKDLLICFQEICPRFKELLDEAEENIKYWEKLKVS